MPKNNELTKESPVYRGAIEIDRDTRLHVALFSNGERIGPVSESVYDAVSDDSLKEFFVTGLEVSSGEEYQIRRDGLSSGRELYIDRDYTFEEVPEQVQGTTYIQTANDDGSVKKQNHLQFFISKPAVIYVGVDERADQLPGWMEKAGFERTDRSVDTTDVAFHLYRKRYEAGKVVLGGNSGAGGSNYQVIISPENP